MWGSNMGSLKQYVKERDEMLQKGNVQEFRKFITKWKDMFPESTYRQLQVASDLVLLITMHKMILTVTTMPEEVKTKSRKWLLDRGYKLTTY